MKVQWKIVKYKVMSSMKPKILMHVITYAHGRNRQFYLGLSEEVAKARFEAVMQGRNEFEVESEGWEAKLETIPFNDAGEAWVGSFGPELQNMMEAGLRRMMAMRKGSHS